MIMAQEHLSYERRLRELLEEKAPNDLINIYKYLMEGVKKTEPDSCQWGPCTGQSAMAHH